MQLNDKTEVSLQCTNEIAGAIRRLNDGDMDAAFLHLGKILEVVAKHYYKHCRSEGCWSEDDPLGEREKEVLKEFKTYKPFDELTLGDLMRFYEHYKVLDGIEHRSGLILEHTRYLTQDKQFVILRNDAIHRRLGDAEMETRHYVQLTTNMLHELGYIHPESVQGNLFPNYYQMLRRKLLKKAQLHRQQNGSNILEPEATGNMKIVREIIPCMYRLSSKGEVNEKVEVDELTSGEGHLLLCGDGGAGKSTILHYLCDQNPDDTGCMPDVSCYEPIPILIYLKHVNQRKDGNYLASHIKDVYQIDLVKEMDELDLLCKEQRKSGGGKDPKHRPFIMLLLDGYNELMLTENEKKVLIEELKHLAGMDVKIIMTSRASEVSIDMKRFFTRLMLQGLDHDAVISYLSSAEVQLDQEKIQALAKNPKTMDLLRNPFTLTIYAEGEKLSDRYKGMYKKLQMKDPNSTGEILWNYIELSVVYDKILQLYVGKPKIQELCFFGIKGVLPKLAWDMASTGAFELTNEEASVKIREYYQSINQKKQTKKQEFEMDAILNFLTKSTCLLVGDDWAKDGIGFRHQHYRDFFAAMYIATDEQGNENNINALANKLDQDLLPFEVRRFLGEILGEHDLGTKEKNTKLCSILARGRVTECGIFNISEIHKALKVFDLNNYTAVDFTCINLNELETEMITTFIGGILKDVTADGMIKQYLGPAQGQSKDDLQQLLLRLINVSLISMSNSDPDTIKEIYQIWFDWLCGLYRQGLEMLLSAAGQLGPSRILSLVLQRRNKKSGAGNGAILHSIAGLLDTSRGASANSFQVRLVKRVLRNERLARYIAGFPLAYMSRAIEKRLNRANLLVGEEVCLGAFTEIKKKKTGLRRINRMLEWPASNVDLPGLAKTIYGIAVLDDLTSTYVIFVLSFCLIQSPEETFNLIRQVYDLSLEENDRRKRRMAQFRVYSSLNYCVQESRLRKEHDRYQVFFREQFRPIMNQICDQVVADLISGTTYEGYPYYFPLGVLNEFDIAIGDHYTENAVMDNITDKEGRLNCNLLKKILLDLSCVAANTFFNQWPEYRERAYLFLENLIEKILPSNSSAPAPSVQSYLDAHDKEIGESPIHAMQESLAILSYVYPQKTAEWLNKIIDKYPDGTSNRKCLMSLANKIEQQKRSCFQTLHRPGPAGGPDEPEQNPKMNDKHTVTGYINNCKSSWLFADLANNVMINFEQVRTTMREKVFENLLDNANSYSMHPARFFKYLLLELFAYLNDKAISETRVTGGKS
jgi:hypothetical protein